MGLVVSKVVHEAVEGEDASDDTGVVGEEEGPHAAECDEVHGPERSQGLGHGGRLVSMAGMSCPDGENTEMAWVSRGVSN